MAGYVQSNSAFLIFAADYPATNMSSPFYRHDFVLICLFSALFYTSSASAQTIIAQAGVTSGTVDPCIACSVTGDANVINANLDDFATVTITAGVNGTGFISAQFAAVEPGGRDAGYVIEDPNDLTKAALLGAISLTTYKAGVQQENASGPGELELGLLGASDRQVVSFTTVLDFDEIRIDVGAVGTAANEIYVYYAQSVANTLPVELASFTAASQGDEVVLRWETTSERNNIGFELEARAAATSRWEQLGFVPGMGTSVEPRSYAFRASALVPGRYRFRLKQQDLDGVVAYSPEVEATVHTSSVVRLSAPRPNPFRTSTAITFNVAHPQRVHVDVFDVLGRRVATLLNDVVEADVSRTIHFEAGHLPSGLYHYTVQGERFGTSGQLLLSR